MKEAMTVSKFYKILGQQANGAAIEIDGRQIDRIEKEDYSVNYLGGRVLISLTPKSATTAIPPRRTTVYDRDTD